MNFFEMLSHGEIILQQKDYLATTVKDNIFLDRVLFKVLQTSAVKNSNQFIKVELGTKLKRKESSPPHQIAILEVCFSTQPDNKTITISSIKKEKINDKEFKLIGDEFILSCVEKIFLLMISKFQEKEQI